MDEKGIAKRLFEIAIDAYSVASKVAVSFGFAKPQGIPAIDEIGNKAEDLIGEFLGLEGWSDYISMTVVDVARQRKSFDEAFEDFMRRVEQA